MAGNCLAQVRADPQRFIDAHAGHQQLHARLDQLAEADHFASPFPPKGDGILVPLPTYGLVVDATSAHALAYVQGDIDGALRGSCQGLQLGRRLLPGGSYLVESILGASLVQANAQLLADMLVELPADYPLPAQCERAMQPMRADEQSLCRAMQGEYAMSRAAIETSAGNSAACWCWIAAAPWRAWPATSGGPAVRRRRPRWMRIDRCRCPHRHSVTSVACRTCWAAC